MAAIFVSAFATSPAFAADLVRGLQWFKPYFYKEPLKNEAHLMVYGQTLPRTTVVVDPKQVFELENSGQTLDPDKNKEQANSTISDQTGCFRLLLKLPYGQVQVPFTFQQKGKQATFVLTINVAADAAQMNANINPLEPATIAAWRSELAAYLQEKLGIEKPVVQKISGWLLRFGAGGNLQAHQADASGTSIKFQKVSLPSAALGASFIWPNWMVNAGYMRNPGKAAAPSEPFSLDGSSFVWDALKAEGGIGLFDSLGYRNRFYATAGLLHQWDPFFSVNVGNVIRIERHQIDSATVGFTFWKEFFDDHLLESALHYQLPVRAQAGGGNSISLSPDFALDASFAYLYRIPKQKFAIGGSWSLQWQQRKYHFTSQSGLAQDGTQSLFLSTVLFTGTFFL